MGGRPRLGLLHICLASLTPRSEVNEPESYSFSRYLTAKKSVDDRALNVHVWSDFVQCLSKKSTSPVRILEIGAGVGEMVKRILKALEDSPCMSVEYTLVDLQSEILNTAKNRLLEWTQSRGWGPSLETRELSWSTAERSVQLRFIPADLFEYAGSFEGTGFDAIVGQAVFDLLPVRKALNALRSLFRNDGIWYLPLHFDGITGFEPVIRTSLDRRIEKLYHQSMDRAVHEGEGHEGAQTGRRLLTHLRATGATLKAVGSSDWIVYAEGEGQDYPEDEAYFLYHILHFVENELHTHPAMDPEVLRDWLAQRRKQIENGELIYLAHQLDVLACTS